jgi:D-aspartate ligase
MFNALRPRWERKPMRPTDRSPHAIVVGLDSFTGLQTARILHRRSIPVIGVASDPGHFCCRTRVCERVVVAGTNAINLIRTLEDLAAQLPGKAVLVPCADESVSLISQHRQRLEKYYYVQLPDPEIVEMLMDKIGFYTYAQGAGLSIPLTFLLHNRSEAERAARKLTYPCVLKPSKKSRTWQQNTNIKAFKIASAEELLATYERCADWAEVLIVQQWIEGTDANLYSCNCYFGSDGDPLVTFIARKLRQWPPETGTSCLGEEVRNDIVLQESIRLFRGVNYRGLGYVEMKRDQRTGLHYIIEPNIGRPTGRSAIAEAGGVELLYTMYCDAVGWPLPANREQKYTGAKWIYWRKDIQSALYYWRRGDLTLREWWQSWRGRKFSAVFSWSDPVPFLLDLFGTIRLLIGTGESQGRRRRVHTNSESAKSGND